MSEGQTCFLYSKYHGVLIDKHVHIGSLWASNSGAGHQRNEYQTPLQRSWEKKKTSTSKCAIRNIHNLCVYIYTVQVQEYYVYIYIYVCMYYIYMCVYYIYIIRTIYIYVYVCICVSVCVGMGQNLLLPYLGV